MLYREYFFSVGILKYKDDMIHLKNLVKFAVVSSRRAFFHSHYFISARKIVGIPSHLQLVCLFTKFQNRTVCSLGKLSKCWKCLQPFEGYELKCPHCNFIQLPRNDANYFSVFDMDVCYDIDYTYLKTKFIQLQTEFHPDKFSISSDEEKVISEEISSFLNTAYSCLSNPYKRGLYLLEINEVPFNENEIQLDAEFLGKIMDLNEQLDDITLKSELKEFERKNDLEINNLSSDVSEALTIGDYNLAKECLQRMKYFITIRNRMKDLQHSVQ